MAPQIPQSPPTGWSLPALRQRLRAAVVWLWQQEGTPGRRARGLAVGVFSGCFPFFGLQTLIGIALASVVRGNHLLAAAGTWISNPFTYLPLYWFNYQVGSWILGPGKGWPGLGVLRQASFWDLGWSYGSRLLVGSTLVGSTAAALSGWLYWRWLRQGEERIRSS